MAYNLYQVQLANAWAQRCEKEKASQELFWTKQAEKPLLYYTGRQVPAERSVAGSKASSSRAPTGYTSKTSYLKTRLDALEAQLETEKTYRRKVEEDLETMRSGSLSSTGNKTQLSGAGSTGSLNK
uniref:Uncharacterized protein n=1 Tax=Dunaliella tertiolecta TaxID=3047 RepID=A0A7S3VU99_DUNTE|mmetsp:Transcript_27546/g.74531  ORF Transcript_27546/g.74531 Transcript_27546/m.74531 type:complete len:126 (+) Transcript_27546:240-617(+)